MNKEQIEKRIDEVSELVGAKLFTGADIHYLAIESGDEWDSNLRELECSLSRPIEIKYLEVFNKKHDFQGFYDKEIKDLKEELEKANNYLKNPTVSCIISTDINYLLDYYGHDEKNGEIEDLLYFLKLHNDAFNEFLIERFKKYYEDRLEREFCNIETDCNEWGAYLERKRNGDFEEDEINDCL